MHRAGRLRHHRHMLVIMRHEGGPELESLLAAAAEALAGQQGCLRVWLSRSPDDPLHWQLLSEWEGAGALRRGLGAYESKLALGPLQSSSAAGGGVYETLLRFADGDREVIASERSQDAGTAGPRR